MKRGRRVGERRGARRREGEQRVAVDTEREAVVARRFAELDTSVRSEQATQHGDDELSVHLDALYAACELAAARRERATAVPLDGRTGALDLMIEIAEVSTDHVALAAERGLQNVLDQLRADVSKRDLARLARVVSARLDETDAAIEAALEARRRARDDVDRWTDSIATAEREARTDLADGACVRLAACHAEVASADAVLFEYRALRDQLRDVGRLILDRG